GLTGPPGLPGPPGPPDPPCPPGPGPPGPPCPGGGGGGVGGWTVTTSGAGSLSRPPSSIATSVKRYLPGANLFSTRSCGTLRVTGTPGARTAIPSPRTVEEHEAVALDASRRNVARTRSREHETGSDLHRGVDPRAVRIDHVEHR